jgi:xanthine dehydrogenase YagS FAD-binding subunit
MEAFEYAHAASLNEALGLLGSEWGETEILAGGTDLLSLMKNRVSAPKRVVNIKGIKELEGVRAEHEGLRIGALVTFDELAAHPAIRNEFRAISQAVEGVKSPQIRSVGTVGGDLCQRPRCWYYRNGFGLLARDEDSKPLVLEGENRYHAILGNEGPAYFVSPSGLAPALIALEARVGLVSTKGRREIPVREFFVIPKKESERENALRPNEILAEVVIPSAARGLRTATYEVRQKEALDWPLACASVALKMTGGNVALARIVLGHVAPTPWPAEGAGKWLTGKPLNQENAAKAGREAVAGAKPLSQNAYKIQLAQVAVKRALLAAKEGA